MRDDIGFRERSYDPADWSKFERGISVPQPVVFTDDAGIQKCIVPRVKRILEIGPSFEPTYVFEIFDGQNSETLATYTKERGSPNYSTHPTFSWNGLANSSSVFVIEAQSSVPDAVTMLEAISNNGEVTMLATLLNRSRMAYSLQ